MVIHGCNSSSEDAEAGGLSFQDFPRLHRDKKLNLINFTILFCQLKGFFFVLGNESRALDTLQ